MLSKAYCQRVFSTLFMANIIRLLLRANRDSDLFDFPFTSNFHRVICAGQPGRDYSRLYQHDQLSDSGSAKQTNLQPTCLWPLSCGSRFFSATRFYNFLVYQLIRSVSPGYPGGDNSDVDDQRQAWRG